MLIEEFHEIQAINEAIKKALAELSSKNADAEEYDKITEQLTKLIKLKEVIANLCLKNHDSTAKKSELEVANNLKSTELVRRKIEFETTTNLREIELDLKREELDERRKVSKETLAVIGANIAGIVMILSYEKVNVIASKALSFVSKLR